MVDGEYIAVAFNKRDELQDRIGQRDLLRQEGTARYLIGNGGNQREDKPTRKVRNLGRL